MKILIIGLGSIGKRHLRILQSEKGLELAALRTTKGHFNKAEKSIIEVYSEQEALVFKPDGIIISNPTSLHVSSALNFVEGGAKFLIEKPLSHSLRDASLLKRYSSQIRVAYCFRFLRLYSFLEKLFANDRPYKLNFRRSYHLPFWHPYTDYRKEYTARKDLGGGVLRTLSHELDLAIKWFGRPKKVMGFVDKLSSLEINTDDSAFLSLLTTDNVRVNLDLDFFSPINTNHGEAFTDKGIYQWDLKKIEFTSYDDLNSKQVFVSNENDLEVMYESQMDDFLNFVRNKKSKAATLSEALVSMRVIDKVSKSNGR